MSDVAVLIPVLGRPERAQAVADSVLASDGRAVPFFLCSPEDRAEIVAVDDVLRRDQPPRGIRKVVVGWRSGAADYARKMNLGYELAREQGFEWVFLGADDLVFHPGWYDACLRVWERTYACVVGTNDLGNSRVIAGNHSTHTLVHRDYLDCGGVIDDPSRLLCELYDHNFVDDEFVQTAMYRGTYQHAHNALVEHLHPVWRKGQEDATYRKGTARFSEDAALFDRRRPMFVARLRPNRRHRV